MQERPREEERERAKEVVDETVVSSEPLLFCMHRALELLGNKLKISDDN
jgi:hypothetical protein